MKDRLLLKNIVPVLVSELNEDSNERVVSLSLLSLTQLVGKMERNWTVEVLWKVLQNANKWCDENILRAIEKLTAQLDMNDVTQEFALSYVFLLVEMKINEEIKGTIICNCLASLKYHQYAFLAGHYVYLATVLLNGLKKEKMKLEKAIQLLDQIQNITEFINDEEKSYFFMEQENELVVKNLESSIKAKIQERLELFVDESMKEIAMD